MLAVYAFVFSVVFEARWDMTAGNRREFALILFAGLLLFTLFADCVNRAPGLMLENVAYIKKVVFPLEVLPWVMLLGALFNAGVSLLVLVAFQVVVRGVPPSTALLLPLVAVPLILLTLGLSWFLSSLGVFIRDLQQIVRVATTALLFLSPIFYPPSAVPEAYRRYVYANPLTAILEQSRQVLFYAQMPDWCVWMLLVAGGWLVACVGYAWFVRTRKGFGDVV
jgi:lipopolysaccharide transport system permease protein